MTAYNSSSARKVGFGDYWWFILTLIPIIHWIPLTIAGIKSKTGKWIFWGVFYLAIMVSTIVITDKKDYFITIGLKSVHGIFALAYFISWVFAIFHTFSIRKEYLYRLSQIPEKFVSSKSYNSGTQYTHIRRNLGKHGRVISAIERLKNQIEFELKKSKNQNSITEELIPVMNNYITQTKELAERDLRLEQLLKNANEKEIDFKIRELKRKIDRTDNAELMQQYMDTISNLEQRKKMNSDFQDQREVIRLKLDSALMEMQKIKMNLINMENLSSQDQGTSYLKDFENKSQELSTYLDVLRDYK